jgi:hypothetical protein
MDGDDVSTSGCSNLIIKAFKAEVVDAIITGIAGHDI